MKKLLVFFTILGVFSCLDNKAQVSYAPGDLKPTTTQSQVEGYVTQILKMHHYKKFEIDDAMSEKIWDIYIKEIDGSKAYFLESDIKKFDTYRQEIDDALLAGDPAPGFVAFNLYRQRYKERSAFIQALLDTPFNFSVDESYDTDREKKTWATTTAQLDDFWRKTVKNQALELRLSGKTDSASVATLKERYKNQDKRMARIKSEQVFQIFMNAFTETIDPHTNYMIPSTAAAFNIDMAQSLEGIGATLFNEGDYVTISDVVPGGPAAKSGLVHKQDKIAGVAQGDDGAIKDIIGWDTNDAVKLIRGPKGTVVRLQLIAADAPAGSAPREVRIVREKIKLEDQVAKKEIIEIEKDKKTYKLGVITLPMFYRDFDESRKGGDFQSTTKDIRKFLEEFKIQNVDGVIVDLRNNGGGSLIEAVDMTGLFISKGPVVQRRESDGRISVESDKDAEVVYAGPLAVMVNRFSASASEIFAGAIQDYKRGIIIGEQTFGKGTVQELADLDRMLGRRPKASTPNGDASSKPEDEERFGQLKITTAKFYRITGSSTQLKGVMPDIQLPAIDSKEFGEEAQATALPWDQVQTSSFSATNNLTEKSLEKLREKYQIRLKTDEDLKLLTNEIAEAEKARDKTIISLQEDKRKKEREEAEKHRKAFAKLNGNGKDKKDLYLIETERVLADLVAFQK